MDILEDRVAPAASLVADINQVPFNAGSNPLYLTNVNGVLFFAATSLAFACLER